MKKINKKGFTLVELVIVIAVIAILAGVLIPTFSGIIKKANLSNDIQLAKNMNTSLAIEYYQKKPVNLGSVQDYLRPEYGKHFTPKSSDYHYYWDEEYNSIYLVNDSNSSFSIYFPELDYEVTQSKCHRLDIAFVKLNQTAPTRISSSLGADNDDPDIKIVTITVTGDGYGPLQYACVLESTYTNWKKDNHGESYPIDESEWDYNNVFEGAEYAEDHYYFARFAGDESHNPSPYIKTKEPCCISKGTKITMADLSLKNIEDIVIGDEVITFNHETGVYEAKAVYIAYVGEYEKCAFTLHFTNDIELSVVGEHDLFERSTHKYVKISEANANSFIGNEFYNAMNHQYETLLSVTYETVPTSFYSIYTFTNYNCIANSMLSVPDDVDFVLNMYEMGDDLIANEETLASDIDLYGLFEYSKDLGVSEEYFNSCRTYYANIWIGKGFVTFDNLISLRNEYANLK